MAGETSLGGTGLSDTLTILGAAGIVIPAFARIRISPVIGFILVGFLAGPFALGSLVTRHPWLEMVTISNPAGIEPFAELGVVFLLFAAGLHLSFRRLAAMRSAVFGVGSAELLLSALLIGAGLLATGERATSAAALGLALAMSSTALVLPIAGTQGPVGRAAFAMLLFEDLALVPMLFALDLLAGTAEVGGLMRTALLGTLVVVGLLIVGRFALPTLFGQAARTKSPELFLAISLLTVILASLATGAVGLSPILGALIAGILVAETAYYAEVESLTAPLRGLALGIFLITVGMRVDPQMLLAEWPRLLVATAAVIAAKALVTGFLLRAAGARHGVAVETGVMMASPSETSLIVLAAAAAAGVVAGPTGDFWITVTALGMTITPLLAAAGKMLARRVEPGEAVAEATQAPGEQRVIIVGCGRVGRLVADMLVVHGHPYVAIDADPDSVLDAKRAGYRAVYADAARTEALERFGLDSAPAVILTMDQPVLARWITEKLRATHPDLPIIARARDPLHAAELYRSGASTAVPETLEASLQLSEAVLVDLGVAMGPVIASIHEKRDELREQIREGAALADKPKLRTSRMRDR